MAHAEIHPAPNRRSRGQVNEILTSRSHGPRRRAALRRLAACPAAQREISFESAGDFLKLPADIHFGEVAGVATTSTGNLWVYYQRGGPNAIIGASRIYINGGARLFEFDRSGKFLREIGTGEQRAPLRLPVCAGRQGRSPGQLLDRGPRLADGRQVRPLRHVSS